MIERNGMPIISEKEYARIHPDFKGVWGTYSRPEWKGRRTAFLPGHGTTLFIEGISFMIVKEGEYVRMEKA